MYFKAKRPLEKCKNCGFCQMLVNCQVNFNEKECIGCKACFLTCPFEEVKLEKVKKKKEIKIEVNGKIYEVPEKITVKDALKLLGYDIFTPCEIGGCYSCVLEIDGEIKPVCITPIKEGMKIKTDLPKDYIPKRIVGGFIPHTVGGVGTPWYLKGAGYIEVALFTAGCNFRCPQCQNWMVTYRGKEGTKYKLLTPKKAAQIMTEMRKLYRVNRMAISGGECTLNKKWLIEYIKELKRLNPDSKARFHVDTNGSLLTPEYIDELVEAGMTDIGIDLKALSTETFMKITGLKNKELAERYKNTAWKAVEYIIENYKDKIFLGIGIPYNKDLISIEEIEEMGKEIFKLDPEVQVCVFDYRGEFRKRGIISRPTFSEMEKVYRVLKDVGLKIVTCQTVYGYIGP